MMIQRPLFLSLVILLLCTTKPALSQSPSPSPAPPAGPTDVVKILKKAGQFKTFIRLLKATQLDSNLNSQLGDTNNGLTILAPSDAAFSSLKKGTLKSLTRPEKMELVQFHIIPVFIPFSQFDTVSNPIKTHAGSGKGFQLNATASGDSVNITTGVTNTSISDTVYADEHLAIYLVNKVLLPLEIFGPPAPAPALATAKAGEEESDDEDGASKKHVSGAVHLLASFDLALFGIGVTFFFFLRDVTK